MPQLRVAVISDDGSTEHYADTFDLTELPNVVDFSATARYSEDVSGTVGN